MLKRIRILWLRYIKGYTFRELDLDAGGDGNSLSGEDILRRALFLPSKYGF